MKDNKEWPKMEDDIKILDIETVLNYWINGIIKTTPFIKNKVNNVGNIPDILWGRFEEEKRII